MSDQTRIHMSCNTEIDHLLREVDHAEEARDHARFMAAGWRRLACLGLPLVIRSYASLCKRLLREQDQLQERLQRLRIENAEPLAVIRSHIPKIKDGQVQAEIHAALDALEER